MDGLEFLLGGFLFVLCVVLCGVVFVGLTKGSSRRSLRPTPYPGPRDDAFKKVHW
jgi:hypothetical protein